MKPENPGLFNRIETAVGKTVTNVCAVQYGYSPAQRLLLSFADGSSLFAKIGTNEFTSEWLHDEQRIYESLSGAFMPKCLGFVDDEVNPILLLEDLSDAHWPPPWSSEQIQQVLAAL